MAENTQRNLTWNCFPVGNGRICCKFFLTERILRSRRGPTRRAIVHRTIVFSSLILARSAKKDTHQKMCAFLLFVYTLDIAFQHWYRPDLLPFCLWQNVRCQIRRAGFEQLSTGQLHLDLQICLVLFLQNKKDILADVLFVLEVPARFELANNGFADRGLTTWLRYHMK